VRRDLISTATGMLVLTLLLGPIVQGLTGHLY
jgi:hypothetical protein